MTGDDFWSSPWTLGVGVTLIGTLLATLVIWIVARLSSDFRVMLKSSFRWLRGLRVMTRQQRADLKAAGRAEVVSENVKRPYLPPANWVIEPKRGRPRGTFTLFRIEEDFVTTNVEVRLDSGSGAKVRSKMSWPEMPPDRAVEFVCLPYTGFQGVEGIGFRVSWDDANGERQERPYYVSGSEMPWGG